jgi:hypothetical protein
MQCTVHKNKQVKNVCSKKKMRTVDGFWNKKRPLPFFLLKGQVLGFNWYLVCWSFSV